MNDYERNHVPPAAPHANLPSQPWSLREDRYDPARAALLETLFALGNGYIGLRGTHEESTAEAQLEGSYLNGFYDTEAIQYPEGAHGLAHTNEFMLRVPNAKRIDLLVDGERFGLDSGVLHAYRRELDIRTGVLERSVEWSTQSGRRVRIVTRRIVLFARRQVAAIEYAVTALNGPCELAFVSAIDDQVSNLQAGDDPRVGSAIEGPSLTTLRRDHGEQHSLVLQRTRNSGFLLATATGVQLAGPAHTASPCADGQQLALRLEQGVTATLTKAIAYTTTRDYAEDAVAAAARSEVELALATGFTQLCAEQERYLAAYWKSADVVIEGDDALQQGVRFNQFHLLQSVGRDGKTNIAAKGVTGEGYEGHYFWDTEIYVFPYFLFNRPEIARRLLDYRYAGLEKARERARAMAHRRGALFPWRTIAGNECSAYFPAGTAQFHINADVAYSIRLYYQATGDLDFVAAKGFEIVFDTARIWLGIGSYDRAGAFCLHCVTGPDEYTALVDNNYYTNAMARMHLRLAVEFAQLLQSERPDDWRRVVGALGLDESELAQMAQAAAAMKLPYDAALGIHPQDDGFLSKQPWDLAGTPPEKFPLLLHFHPLVIYRRQVCKQADVVLALLLLSDEFALDDKRRDFDFYERVTTHDSSLSSCIFSMIAAEVGYDDKAYQYFMHTARLDLDDSHGNTGHGIHTAAMAGTWLGVAFGFGGMRLQQGRARFMPRLPAQWTAYSFQVQLRDAWLQVRVSAGGVEYRLAGGAALEFDHAGQPVSLTAAAPVQHRELA
ncbi:MAG TPA: glycosyl hydrolase family 65 protein [Burkholderiaceae bacterium]